MRLSDSAMRDIRRALLEADVALPIAKKFIEDVKKEAIGKEIIRSITPAQMITKIVNDQLIQILGSASPEFQINDNQVHLIYLQDFKFWQDNDCW